MEKFRRSQKIKYLMICFVKSGYKDCLQQSKFENKCVAFTSQVCFLQQQLRRIIKVKITELPSQKKTVIDRWLDHKQDVSNDFKLTFEY
jgi:hypothetical protein